MPNPLASRLQPVPETALFQDPDWYIWGGSMTRGPGGQYYLLYARWPRRFQHGGWLTHEDVLVTDRRLRMADGSIRQYMHLERPQLYIENGTPRALCFAADMNRDHSCNIQVPLGASERLSFRL